MSGSNNDNQLRAQLLKMLEANSETEKEQIKPVEKPSEKVAVLENEKPEIISVPEEQLGNDYENMPMEDVLASVKNHSSHLWASVKIIKALESKKTIGPKVQSDELLADLKSYKTEKETVNLLRKSGLEQDLLKKIEQSDFRECYEEINKYFAVLDKQLASASVKYFSSGQKNKNILLTPISNSYQKLYQAAEKIDNKFVQEKLQTLMAGIFSEEGSVYKMLSEKLSSKNLRSEELQKWLSGMTAYYNNVILENLADWKANFGAMIKYKTDSSLVDNHQKLDSKEFNLKQNFSLLEKFVKEEQSNAFRTDWLNLWNALKDQSYYEILTDKAAKQKFVETLSSDKTEQGRIKNELNIVDNIFSGMVDENGDSLYSQKRKSGDGEEKKKLSPNKDVISWFDVDQKSAPSLAVQMKLTEGLKKLCYLNNQFFIETMFEIIDDADKKFRDDPKSTESEKSAFYRFLKIWDRNNREDQLLKFSLAEQKEIKELLAAWDWQGLTIKFNHLIQLARLNRPASVGKEETKKADVPVKSLTVKPEEPMAPAEKTAEKKAKLVLNPEQIERNVLVLREKVLDLLEEMNSPSVDSNIIKRFVRFGDDMLAAISKTREDFYWEDAVKLFSESNLGFFKGVLSRLLKVESQIEEFADKTKIDDVDLLALIDANYVNNSAFDGLLEYDASSHQFVINKKKRGDLNVLNNLYNNLFLLNNRDLDNVPSTELRAVLNSDGSINQEILKRILDKTKVVSPPADDIEKK